MSAADETQKYKIAISVDTTFLGRKSFEDGERFVFSYTITISNKGDVPATLLKRYWLIKDGDERVEEVRGDGVVGEQPYLLPGEAFRYTSGTFLESPVGTMEGHYHMIADDGNNFEAEIPRFHLTAQSYLH